MGKTGKPRGVARYTTSGLFIQRYPSISLAAKIAGVSTHAISNACKDPYKEVAGFKWKYSKYGKLKPKRTKTKAKQTKKLKSTDAERAVRMNDVLNRIAEKRSK